MSNVLITTLLNYIAVLEKNQEASLGHSSAETDQLLRASHEAGKRLSRSLVNSHTKRAELSVSVDLNKQVIRDLRGKLASAEKENIDLRDKLSKATSDVYLDQTYYFISKETF